VSRTVSRSAAIVSSAPAASRPGTPGIADARSAASPSDPTWKTAVAPTVQHDPVVDALGV
jgi:hypothetical protein